MKFLHLKKGDVEVPKDTKVVPAETFSDLIESSEILSQAKQDVEELIAGAKEECVELKKEAKRQGLQEGLEKFAEQLLIFDRKLKEVRLDVENQMLPLALEAAKKIVGEELKTNPEAIVSIVSKAIRPVLQHHNIKIWVNRADVPFLEKAKEALKGSFERIESFSIEERSDVTQGSCVIETEAGIINATIENQWRAIQNAFENFGKGD
ncbi:MAG: hypothetical protein MRY21_00080 [Simkaniaceae bacterium]|nr:hypothetical protein [Simkaniaceae bacterium]